MNRNVMMWMVFSEKLENRSLIDSRKLLLIKRLGKRLEAASLRFAQDSNRLNIDNTALSISLLAADNLLVRCKLSIRTM